MGVWKSPVWKYFVAGTGLAKCKLCQKSVKRTGGNTSNLIAHLRSSHHQEFNSIKVVVLVLMVVVV